MEYRLSTPIREEDVRKLRAGDVVYLTGTVVTARDAAHRRILEWLKEGKPLPVDLKDGALYHCGPVVRKVGETWEVVAAGPTTSTRMEPYEAEVIEKLGVRIIIGKGGMGAKTREACQKFGAVYAAFTGGAGALAAKAIKEVLGVHWLDLGVPEALWVFRVEEFGPLLVVTDSHGRDLLEEVKEKVRKKKEEMLSRI